ncbi:MAG: glycosyltransferase family 4 protein, partial [Pseudomonadota bacterium]
MAFFAIPGDITRKTGGFIYDRKVLDLLQAKGRNMHHLPMPAGFPDPTDDDMAKALADLEAVPDGVPVLVDGLVLGAIDPEGLRKVSAPIVGMIHHPLGLESGLPPHRAEFLLRNEAAALAHTAHVVVPSPHTAEILVERFAVPSGKITVAPPGLTKAIGASTRATPPLILAVGSLVERKGHDVLLKALAQIADLPWQAEIVGGAEDAPVVARLKDLRHDLALDNQVTFVGTLDEAALGERYAAASVFALATRYEGYGMVFAEAMIHGLPIVACSGGAVPDTVAPGAGILVAVDDTDAFADALRRVLSDEPLRAQMATASSEAGSALPTWDATAKTIAQVLDA